MELVLTSQAVSLHTVQVQKAVLALQEALLKKTVNIQSPFDVIQAVYRTIASFRDLPPMKRKDFAIQVLRRIAAGADGVSGTDDDLIPVDIVQKITVLLESDVVGNILDLLPDGKCSFVDKLLGLLSCLRRPARQTMPVAPATTPVVTPGAVAL